MAAWIQEEITRRTKKKNKVRQKKKKNMHVCIGSMLQAPDSYRTILIRANLKNLNHTILFYWGGILCLKNISIVIRLVD